MHKSEDKKGSLGKTMTNKTGFLNAFEECGSVTKSAEVAGIGRRTHYLWLDSDREYAKAFDAAGKMAAIVRLETLEDEAFKRAKASSDTLLIFLLKAESPMKYKDRVEHTGKDGEPLALTEQERAARFLALFELARKRRAGLPVDGPADGADGPKVN